VPVSIKDIAKAAGVTPGTVSRALRDSPRVNPETKKRIQRLADEMGYAPDAQARSLVTGRTQTIGVVVTTMTDPFIGSIVQSIESAAHDQGYAVILASSNDIPEREIAAVKMLQSRRVDGVIVTSSRVGALYQDSLDQLRVPVVLINSLAQQGGRQTFSLNVDNSHGGYLATNYLIQKGHRRIAYVAAPADRVDSMERMAGYRDALIEAGIDSDPSLVAQGTGSAGGGQGALTALLSLDDAPSAVFCYNDMTAIGMMRAARKARLSVPENLSIVGFDDIPFASYTHPALTTVAQPIREMGQQALQMALDLLGNTNPENRDSANFIVKGKLVIRESSGAAQHPKYR
jgi:DNA-binding LacI/PurR family transcriptional regulator